MRFNPKARLDPSQIDDQRGAGDMGGGMGFPFPGGGGSGGGSGIRVGGIGGIILILLFVLGSCLFGNGNGLPQFPGQDAGTSQGQSQQQDNSGGGDFANCKTGQDANTNEDCLLVGIANSVNGFWEQQFPKETGETYTPAQTVPFSGQVSTGCGGATSDVGPFYCPNDGRVYLDTTFFGDMLQGRLGGKDSAFTRAYVIAHEYGHHIENQLGIMGQVRTQQGANSDAVRLELMADCLAGAWTKNATEPDANGQSLIEEVSDQDITDAIVAAQTVGDDRIQKRTQGRVNPDAWTHGSAQQRETAFRHGMKNGTIKACNLFN